MTLPPLAGHEELRERLARAASEGTLPQSLLFSGPEGIGKQRLALWLSRLLLCGEESGCGACRACRFALRLEHPDLHWFFPLPRPSGSRARLREKLEEARREEIARRRDDPLAPPEGEGVTGIYLAAVEQMRSMAVRRPAMGRRAVFVVGDADRMVSQASSPEAANAFLKMLEEPPADTFVLLTSSRPESLLPTIRSRVLAVRVPPVSPAVVREFLLSELDLEEDEAERVSALSQGSIGRALQLLTEEGRSRRERAGTLLRAALSPGRADRLAYAAGLGSSGARADFADVLETTAEQLRDLLAASLGSEDLTFDPPRVRAITGEDPDDLPSPGALLRALEHVEEARDAAEANVNPQAIAGVLLDRISRAVRSSAGTPRPERSGA